MTEDLVPVVALAVSRTLARQLGAEFSEEGWTADVRTTRNINTIEIAVAVLRALKKQGALP